MWAAYMKCAPLNAGINVICDTALSRGFELKPTTDNPAESQVIIEDRVENLLESPGDSLNGIEFFKGVIASLEIFGDAWVEIQYKDIYTAAGQLLHKEPVNLWLLPPQEMFIDINKETGAVEGYRQVHNGKTVNFDPDEVLHIAINRGPGAQYGTPKMVSAKGLIATWLKAVEYNHDYYFTKGRPRALINLGSVSEAEIKRLIARIDNDIKDDGGGYTFINTPEMNVAPLADSNKDLEFSEMLRYVETRILSVYNVPNIKIGISETGGAGAIVGATQISAFYDSIEAVITTVEAAFNQFFKATFGLKDFELNIKSPRPIVDPGMVSAYAALLDKQVLTPNEIRALMGLKPIDGGDSVIAPAPTMAAMPPVQYSTRYADPIHASNPADVSGGGEIVRENSPPSTTPPSDHPFNKPDGIYNVAVAVAAKTTAQYIADITAGIKDIYNRTLKRATDETKVVNPDTLKADINKVVNDATDALITQSETQALNMWLEGVQSVGGDPNPDAVPRDIIKAINTDYGAVPIKTFSADIAAKISDTIDQLTADGAVSLYKYTSTLQDTIPETLNAESWKLERIERTRFNRIANTSRTVTMQRMGTKAYKRVGVRDSRQSEICRALDGLIFPVSDLKHIPPSHPNCRCVTVPLTDAQYNEALAAGKIQGSDV